MTKKQKNSPLLLLLAFVVVAVLSAGVGILGFTLVKSPSELAKEAAPPKPTVLTAAVTTGAIKRTLVLQGKVQLGNSIDISPHSPASGSLPVVTKVPVKVGSRVRNGSCVLVVADRPVIVLQDSIPLIRDLGVGITGPDVTRFQNALRRAGFQTADRAGYFGGSTAAAVAALYKRNGFSSPPSGQPLVSMAEIDLVPGSFPARVVAVQTGVGIALGDKPALTLTTEPAEIGANVDPTDATSLHSGMGLRVSGQDKSLNFDGSVGTMGAAVQTDDSGFQVPIIVTAKSQVPIALIGATVEISVDLTSDATQGIIVPISAISSAADGSTFVVVYSNHRKTKVPVHVEENGDGEARVSATGGGLRAGGQVVVGFKQ